MGNRSRSDINPEEEVRDSKEESSACNGRRLSDDVKLVYSGVDSVMSLVVLERVSDPLAEGLQEGCSRVKEYESSQRSLSRTQSQSNQIPRRSGESGLSIDEREEMYPSRTERFLMIASGLARGLKGRPRSLEDDSKFCLSSVELSSEEAVDSMTAETV